MTKKIRPLTREDWNDISKLTFRNSDDEILELKVFESVIGEIHSYPVRVVSKNYNGLVKVNRYTIDGFFSANKQETDLDIGIKELEPIYYEEIVKELMIKKAIVKKGKVATYITEINFGEGTFYWHLKYDFERIKDMKITFDLKTFYTFNQYLEIREKEQSNDTK
ncbi:MAG: hypothetical protein EKK55_22465 [Rhodocyclaceae bacterium]|nr:MAG: hypothetical protein EKK55_22465 [Rhodocyclaceae bacterium]